MKNKCAHTYRMAGVPAILFALSLLLPGCGPGSPSNATDAKTGSDTSFYALDDFPSVKKFDVHIHINSAQTAFMEQAKKDRFQFLDIVDDRPFGITMEEQQKLADQHLQSFSGQMFVATTFKVDHWGEPEWQKNTLDYLRKQFSKGSGAVKIWKNIGMDLRDKSGTFVMVDNPALDPILDSLAKDHIPVIAHNGEPRDCWLPLDKMTFSQGYYGQHPEYHMYLHPEYPSYEDQINARDHMLEKHPDLAFIAAHLGSLEWSLDELAKRLDKFPNMLTDLSRMPYLQLHTKNDREKTRRFFIKYQDRLVYATDQAINDSKDTIDLKNKLHERWLDEWKFFVTDSAITLKGHGQLKGLRLPRQVIDKIYLKNALRWLKGVADSPQPDNVETH